MSSIGPQIPGDLVWKREKGREDEEYEDVEGDVEGEEAYADAYGPELHPDLTRKPTSTTHDTDSDTQGDEIGPRAVKTQADGDDDDPVRAFMERERRRMKAREAKEAGAGGQRLQREEWMLVPPSSSSVVASIEQPGKIKARQFSRTNAGTKTRVENSLWTETPAEKQARIREEVEGKRKRATDVDVGETGECEVEVRESKRSRETEEMVESYNRKRRGGKSLLEMHRSREEERKKGKGKDGEEVIWDRERDMSVGGRLMDDRQRSRMIQDARGLSSRFSQGKTGRFL